jgi:hypothetical protein
MLFVHDKRYQQSDASFRALKGLDLMTWTRTTIDETRWEHLQGHSGAKGFIVQTKSGKLPKQSNKVNVDVDEWVCLRIFI